MIMMHHKAAAVTEATMRFNRAEGDNMTIANTTQFTNLDDFNFECRIKLLSTPSTTWTIFQKRTDNSVTCRFAFVIDTARRLWFLSSFNGTAWNFNFTSTTQLTVGTEYHAAFSKLSTTARIYVNGAPETSATASGTYSTDTNNMNIGGISDGTYNFLIDAEIKLLRFDKVALRTGTTSFTPPQSASDYSGATAITSNTALLLVSAVPIVDLSGQSNTITNNGVTNV